MKNVLLSADSEISVFSVPDEVADNLEKYCLKFCNWLDKSPNADKYHVKVDGIRCVCYNEKDFIDYLNQYVCKEKSVLISTLANVYEENELSEENIGLPYFNF